MWQASCSQDGKPPLVKVYATREEAERMKDVWVGFALKIGVHGTASYVYAVREVPESKAEAGTTGKR